MAVEPIQANLTAQVATARQQAAQQAAQADSFAQMLRQAARQAGQRAVSKTADLLAQKVSDKLGALAAKPAARQQTDTAGTDAPATAGDAPAADDSAAGNGGPLQRKLNEAVAVAFLAPLLADAMGGERTQNYFLNGAAEKTYSRQLYLEIASRIGASGKLPLGKPLARALQRQMGGEAETGS